jgi:DMSO/TMAO reductase YedYZ heme-binding membrane subunit
MNNSRVNYRRNGPRFQTAAHRAELRNYWRAIVCSILTLVCGALLLASITLGAAGIIDRAAFSVLGSTMALFLCVSLDYFRD